MNNSPQKSAINSQINDLISLKYLGLNKGLQRGAAFNELSASIICESDIQSEDIVDGDDDNGLDVVFINSNDQGIFINILNCKSSETEKFSEVELGKIKNGLFYTFEADKKKYKKLENQNLLAKIEEIREDKENIVEVNCFYCAFSGDNNKDKKIKREVEEIQNYFSEYFKTVYPNAKFNLSLINAEDLFYIDAQRKQSLRNEKISIPYYGDKVISNEVETEKIDGRLATVRGEEIAKLVEKYGESLFEKNVRGWMSFRKYNKDILYSCSSDNESELFWFLNNGLTIVCDKCVPEPDKKILKLTAPQIINGQQTARVLEKAYKDGILKENVKVLLKIYVTTAPDIIIKVAKATNSQLVVKSRDLVSNNTEQLAIQNEFIRNKYGYERQRGEKKSKTADIKENFNNFFVAQSVLSTLFGQPSFAKKKQEDKIFGEPNYSKIFRNNSVDEILTVTLLCNFCLGEGLKLERKNISDQIKYFAFFHIARIIWFNLKNKEKMKNDEIISIIQNHKNKKKLNNIYTKASNILLGVYKKYNKKEKIISIGHLFSRLEVDKDINKLLFK
ncbi:MAG: AIPR family protein [Patescibacteria group bacterium]|nr:AIPR family protein [Patescibacteria group bacterium]